MLYLILLHLLYLIFLRPEKVFLLYQRYSMLNILESMGKGHDNSYMYSKPNVKFIHNYQLSKICGITLIIFLALSVVLSDLEAKGGGGGGAAPIKTISQRM